jgi:hypothetical protein
MKKLMFATLSLVCMFAISSGGQSASAAPTAPEFGACRFYCGATSFTTSAACNAVCSSDCEKIC